MPDPDKKPSSGDATLDTVDDKGAPTPKEKAKDDKPDKKMWKVKINDEEKEIDEEELVRGYQSRAASSQAFQAAAEARKLQEDFEALKHNDEGAFRRIAARAGWSEEQAEAALSQHRKMRLMNDLGIDPNADAEDPDPVRKGTDKPKGGDFDLDALSVKVAEKLAPVLQKNFKVSTEHLDPKLQKVLGKLLFENLTGDLTTHLDKDEYTGKILRTASSRQKSAVNRMVQKETSRRSQAGDDITNPEVQKKIIQAVKIELQDLGVTPTTATPLRGLGSAATSAGGFHQSDTPKERPKEGMASSEYDEYLVDSLNRALLESASED